MVLKFLVISSLHKNHFRINEASNVAVGDYIYVGGKKDNIYFGIMQNIEDKGALLLVPMLFLSKKNSWRPFA